MINDGDTDPAAAMKKPAVLTQVASSNSHSSFASSGLSRVPERSLSKLETEKLNRRIEEQYKTLASSETKYRYYIEDQRDSSVAHQQLKKATDGTYFLRPANSEEQRLTAVYMLEFVSHREVAKVPICYSEQRKTFWFLSGCGLGSEVQREYGGLDLLIKHKHENNFYELQYPFKICLYRPLVPTHQPCLPLPDELRIIDRQTTFLHELASQGLTHFLQGLIQVALDTAHPLKEKATCILRKINGRNQQGLTPLIVAIQAKKYDFIDLLLSSGADVNTVDAHGRSPLHHACEQPSTKLIHKLLKDQADPHYFNRGQPPDGLYHSHLSALHYLAMAANASEAQIEKCVRLLMERGCPLMPLTKDGKSPFDLARTCNNTAYERVQTLANIYQFNSIQPTEVASRTDAKAMLRNLTNSNLLGKIRSRLNPNEKADRIRKNGLFLFFKTRVTRQQPDSHYGLCVYHNKRVCAYAVSEEHSVSVANRSIYRYALRPRVPTDDQNQVIVFKSHEELIYHHTKHQGVLPTVLTDFVRKENGEWVTISAADLLLSTELISDGVDDPDPPNEPFDVRCIDRIALSDIHFADILEENHRRLIWRAKVRNENTGTFAIIIKDYLPKAHIDAYKTDRLKQLTGGSSSEAPPDGYKYTSRSRLDHQHESRLLLSNLRNHPFIVHAFHVDSTDKHDLRIFMEYLPDKDLHSYLIKANTQTLQSPLVNAYDWIYQLAQVMGHLAKLKIVHRDLATRNILLRNERHIVLSDFGLSRPAGEELKGRDCVFSARWAPPECFEREQIVASSTDVWAFGVVVWEIFTFGALPYDTDANLNEQTDSQQLIRVLRRFLVEQGRHLSKPELCSVGLFDLVCCCWRAEVDKRPHFVEIIDELNGTNPGKDRFVVFNSEDRRAWRKARAHYTSIALPVNVDSGYVDANDVEHDPSETIMAL